MRAAISKWLVVGIAGGLLVGCGSKPPKQAGEENNFDVTPTGDPVVEAPPSSSSEEGGLTEAQEEQMTVALRRGGEKAANCGQVVPDAPRGEGEVHVIFDGAKGRVTDVNVGAPWAGTPAEACIKRSFVGEIVLPFDGVKTVPYSVKIPEKGAAPGKDAPKDKKK